MTLKNLDVAGAQIAGKRDYQEDFFSILPESRDEQRAVCLLADGMGGHAAGDVAASIAIAAFTEALDSPIGPSHPEFMRCVDRANRAIAKSVADNSAQEGMGTTLVAMEIVGNECSWISIGDSPLFHISGNEISRVNADHSMATQLDGAARRGEITEDEARNSPSRNMLLSALTGEAIGRIDYRPSGRTLYANDWLILASDGLETLQPSEILAIANSTKSLSAEAVCDRLLAAVENHDKPHQDNATVIVVRCPSTLKERAAVNNDEVTTRPIVR